MLIILIWAAITILSLVGISKGGPRIKTFCKNFFPVVVFSTVIVVFSFTVTKVVFPPELQKLDAERSHICSMIEAVSDGSYENVSAIEVGNMILEWNDRCLKARYWSNNPWTSWFWNKKQVEHLIPIGATPMFNMFGE